MRVLPFALLFAAGAAAAQPAPPDLQPVPDGPPTLSEEEGAPVVPEITIRRLADGTIREYRVNGQLYMVQVIPVKGIPYFLVDVDGDGNLETRYNDLDPRIMIPAWVILRW